jgi:hypothetical protein
VNGLKQQALAGFAAVESVRIVAALNAGSKMIAQRSDPAVGVFDAFHDRMA